MINRTSQDRSRKIIKLLKKDKELEDVDLVFIVPFVIWTMKGTAPILYIIQTKLSFLRDSCNNLAEYKYIIKSISSNNMLI